MTIDADPPEALRWVQDRAQARAGPWAVEDTHPPRGAGSAVPRQRSEDSAEETVA